MSELPKFTGDVPTPREIKEARLAANLTRPEAGALVYVGPYTWQKWEYEGDNPDYGRKMHKAYWELFLMKASLRSSKSKVSSTRPTSLAYLPEKKLAGAIKVIERMPENTDEEKLKRARARWVLVLLRETKFSLAKIVGLTMGGLLHLPEFTSMAEELALYRSAYGLPDTVDERDTLPAVMRLVESERERHMTRAGLHLVVQQITGANN